MYNNLSGCDFSLIPFKQWISAFLDQVIEDSQIKKYKCMFQMLVFSQLNGQIIMQEDREIFLKSLKSISKKVDQ